VVRQFSAKMDFYVALANTYDTMHLHRMYIKHECANIERIYRMSVAL